LVSSISESDDPERFTVIFGHAVEEQAIGVAVYDAARLLHEANPSCPIPCELAVESMLPNWDVSIQEVPWYLKRQFGADGVKEAVKNVRKHVSSDGERSTLDSILYWVGVD